MSDEWENIVIETGVDTLLNYLAENGEASVSEISDDLGVTEKRIKEWAKALDDNDFLHVKYSARHGMVLQYTKQNHDNANKKLEDLKKDVKEERTKVNKELKKRSSDIDKAKKDLNNMVDELEDHREREEEVKSQIEELEEMEERIEETLEEQKEKERKLHSNSVKLISRIDSVLNRVDEAEDKAETFEKKEQIIKKKIKALKKLEKHAETVEDLDTELQELKEEEKEEKTAYTSFFGKIRNLFGSGKSTKKEYDKLLSMNVHELKTEIRNMEDPDYKSMLEAEKSGSNRKTVVRFLEREME